MGEPYVQRGLTYLCAFILRSYGKFSDKMCKKCCRNSREKLRKIEKNGVKIEKNREKSIKVEKSRGLLRKVENCGGKLRRIWRFCDFKTWGRVEKTRLGRNGYGNSLFATEDTESIEIFGTGLT